MMMMMRSTTRLEQVEREKALLQAKHRALRAQSAEAAREAAEREGQGAAALNSFVEAQRKLQADLDAPQPTAAADAVSALVNLGYGQTQAGAAVAAALRKAGDDQPTEKLIRLALKELALA